MTKEQANALKDLWIVMMNIMELRLYRVETVDKLEFIRQFEELQLDCKLLGVPEAELERAEEFIRRRKGSPV